MKQPVMEYPIQTHSQACHQARPEAIMAEEIIQVLILKESATQNATKFHGPHCRSWLGTGLRSSLLSWPGVSSRLHQSIRSACKLSRTMCWSSVIPDSFFTESIDAKRRSRGFAPSPILFCLPLSRDNTSWMREQSKLATAVARRRGETNQRSASSMQVSQTCISSLSATNWTCR